MQRARVLLIVWLSAMSLVVSLPSGSPAATVYGSFAFTAQAHLYSGFPCNGNCNGTLSGSVRGIGVDFRTLSTDGCTVKACSLGGSYVYNEPAGNCYVGRPIAPLGTANGSYFFGSTSGTFSWTRIGVTGILLLQHPTGAGVGVFVPPTTCYPSTATIAGVVSLTGSTDQGASNG